MFDWKAGYYKSVPVYVNISVLLGLFYIISIVSGIPFFAGSPFAATVSVIAMTLGLYLSILYHEMGHAKKALEFGYKVEKIYIMAIGGAAIIDLYDTYSKPLNEVKVSIAGPLNSFRLLLLFSSWLVFCLTFYTFAKVFMFPVYTFAFLALANLITSIGNMIPIYPLDGGRSLRGYLSYKLGFKKGNLYSYRISIVLLCILLAFGIFIGDFITILIVVWLGFGLFEERKHVQQLY